MKYKGFTLWESLVIVVILGVAAAILFPVFFGVRENGRPRDYCQSNLRQIGLGLKQYIQDYNERYPPASTDWPQVAQPYLKSWQIFQCPLDGKASTGIATEITTDYFLNARLLGAPEKKISDLNLTILIGDGLSNQKSATLSQLPASWISDSNSPANRHLDGANYGFADGHVKWLKPQKITLDKPSKNSPTFLIQ